MSATAKPRLGRGLDALIGGAADGDGEALAGRPGTVPVGQIAANPFQPRKIFDDEELTRLSESIHTHGVLQPLVVRVVDGQYQLIAGERRLRAAQVAGLAEVPVHVVALEDQQVLEAALVENVQRTDLNPIEKAQGFRDYLDRFQMTQEHLATRLGLDRTTISNLLGLLHLPDEVQTWVRVGQLSLGHAKVLKGVPDAEKQVALGKETIAKNLSVHALELVAKQQKAEVMGGGADGKPAGKPPVEKTAHVQSIEDELRSKLAVRVEVQLRGKDKGKLVIGFESNDDFDRIVEVLRR